MDFIYNFGAGGGEVLVAGGGFVDEDEGGFRVDADAVEELAFQVTLFDEPAGVDLEAIVAVVNRVALGFGCGGRFLGEVDIFEERAGGWLDFRVGKLVGANVAYDVADALG